MVHLTGIIDVSTIVSQNSVPACCPPHKSFSSSKREAQDLLLFVSHQSLTQILQRHLVLHYDSWLTSSNTDNTQTSQLHTCKEPAPSRTNKIGFFAWKMLRTSLFPSFSGIYAQHGVSLLSIPYCMHCGIQNDSRMVCIEKMLAEVYCRICFSRCQISLKVPGMYFQPFLLLKENIFIM